VFIILLYLIFVNNFNREISASCFFGGGENRRYSTAVFGKKFGATCRRNKRLWIWIWMGNFISTASLKIEALLRSDSQLQKFNVYIILGQLPRNHIPE